MGLEELADFSQLTAPLRFWFVGSLVSRCSSRFQLPPSLSPLFSLLVPSFVFYLKLQLRVFAKLSAQLDEIIEQCKYCRVSALRATIMKCQSESKHAMEAKHACIYCGEAKSNPKPYGLLSRDHACMLCSVELNTSICDRCLVKWDGNLYQFKQPELLPDFISRALSDAGTKYLCVVCLADEEYGLHPKQDHLPCEIQEQIIKVEEAEEDGRTDPRRIEVVSEEVHVLNV